jgi:hypothetical protein
MKNDTHPPNQPVHEIRLGSVRAAIWKNQTSVGVRHNVTVNRIYRDDNQWKTTESFGRDDLLLLGKVLDLAHTWIHEHAEAGTTGLAGGGAEETGS